MSGPSLPSIRRFLTDPANRLWLDGLLAGALVAAMVYDITANRSQGTHRAWAGARPEVLLFACAAPASLTLRRVAPEIPSVILGFTGLLIYPVTQTHWVLTPALAVALYSLGVWRSWPRSLAVAASGLIALPVLGRLAAVRESELVKQNQEHEQVQREQGDVLQGFQRIGDAGRKALGELDRMLSALRDAHGVPDPSLTPQPGLKELRALTDGLSEQGLPVSLELRGETDRVHGGTLTISSHPGTGTTISALLPYSEEQANA